MGKKKQADYLFAAEAVQGASSVICVWQQAYYLAAVLFSYLVSQLIGKVILYISH